MNEELKPCPFCGCKNIAVGRFMNYGRKLIQFHCPKCNAHSGVSEDEQRAINHWNTRPIEDEKDKEIDSLKVELNNLRHFCDSIFDMAKRNNGVLYFEQDDGIWKIETGKDTDVPANPTDNNVGSMEV